MNKERSGKLLMFICIFKYQDFNEKTIIKIKNLDPLNTLEKTSETKRKYGYSIYLYKSQAYQQCLSAEYTRILSL